MARICAHIIELWKSGQIESVIEACNQFDEIVDLSYRYFEIPNPGSSYAHIVIDDYNIDDSSIDFCFSYKPQWIEFTKERILKYSDEYSFDEDERVFEEYIREVDSFLEWLKTLPIEIREHE